MFNNKRRRCQERSPRTLTNIKEHDNLTFRVLVGMARYNPSMARPGDRSRALSVPAGPRALLDRKTALQGLLENALNALKPSTRMVYLKGLQEFAVYLGLPDAVSAAAHLTSLPHGDANALAYQYRSELMKPERKLKPSTINTRMSALPFAVKLGRIQGFISWSLDIQILKVEAYRDTSGPGLPAIEAVDLELSKATDPISVRNRAILNLLFNQGLRRGEVVSLDLGHVDFDKGRIMVLGKARGDREPVTMTEGTIQTMKNWISIRGHEPGPLFQSLDRRSHGHRLDGSSVYRMVNGYGLERPHGVRHSAITEALNQSNGDLRAVMRFSRHRDPKVVIKYDDNRKDLAGQIASSIDLGRRKR